MPAFEMATVLRALLILGVIAGLLALTMATPRVDQSSASWADVVELAGDDVAPEPSVCTRPDLPSVPLEVTGPEIVALGGELPEHRRPLERPPTA